MASISRSSGTAAFRYASALTDLASEQGKLPQIEQDVTDIRAMIAASPELQTLLRSPLMESGAQTSALTSLADRAQLSPLMKNLLLTVAKNRRLSQLDSILSAVQENIAARRGEVTATVESAAPLSDAQKKSMSDSLSKTIGRPVAITSEIKPDLIGGVIVTLGSLMIDDSVKTKLARLGRAMKHSGTKAA